MLLHEHVDIDDAAADRKLPHGPDDRLFHKAHVAERPAERQRIDLSTLSKDELFPFERICRGEAEQKGIKRADRDERGFSPRHFEKAQAFFENSVKGNLQVIRLDAERRKKADIFFAAEALQILQPKLALAVIPGYDQDALRILVKTIRDHQGESRIRKAFHMQRAFPELRKGGKTSQIREGKKIGKSKCFHIRPASRQRSWTNGLWSPCTLKIRASRSHSHALTGCSLSQISKRRRRSFESLMP